MFDSSLSAFQAGMGLAVLVFLFLFVVTLVSKFFPEPPPEE
jgi:hypothetical protein